jgi:hypothetical protein
MPYSLPATDRSTDRREDAMLKLPVPASEVDSVPPANLTRNV